MYRDAAGPTRTVARLQGMHDLSQEPWRLKRDLQDRLMELFGSFGYRRLETPILEPTELFLRKSGGELASRIYSFSDPGSASVSLRPEFTSSVMRYCLENAAEIDLPARWRYGGPVFRYEGSHPEASGQITQVGVELVGSPSVMADVEVLGLAALVPSRLGLADWRLELTDLDVLDSVLDAVGVSERARTFIVGSVPRLQQGRRAVAQVLEEALRLHLTSQGSEDDYLGRAIEDLDDGQARVVLRGLLQWSAADQLGQRDPEEVVDRLLRKHRGGDDEAKLRRGLELASDLAAIRGERGEALDAVGAVVRAAGADGRAFDRLSEFLDLLLADAEIAAHLTLDFGLVRGLAYYNGVVFEVRHPAWPGALGGGAVRCTGPLPGGYGAVAGPRLRLQPGGVAVSDRRDRLPGKLVAETLLGPGAGRGPGKLRARPPDHHGVAPAGGADRVGGRRTRTGPGPGLRGQKGYNSGDRSTPGWTTHKP